MFEKILFSVISAKSSRSLKAAPEPFLTTSITFQSLEQTSLNDCRSPLGSTQRISCSSIREISWVAAVHQALVLDPEMARETAWFPKSERSIHRAHSGPSSTRPRPSLHATPQSHCGPIDCAQRVQVRQVHGFTHSIERPLAAVSTSDHSGQTTVRSNREISFRFLQIRLSSAQGIPAQPKRIKAWLIRP